MGAVAPPGGGEIPTLDLVDEHSLGESERAEQLPRRRLLARASGGPFLVLWFSSQTVGEEAWPDDLVDLLGDPF